MNGRLRFSPDYPLIAPPALGMEVAPPSHLITLAQATGSASIATTGDQVPQSGSRPTRRA